MQKYEVLYILSSTLDSDKREAFIEKFSKFVTDDGGQIESINKWGMRKLAYPINFKNEGFYVLMTYTAKAGLNAELERNFRIAKDEVIRFMVSKVEIIKAEPARPLKAKVSKQPDRQVERQPQVQQPQEQPVAEQSNPQPAQE
ncbi:MAG: 30S ribosomal protein S6 [Firmicutes bacterium]|nr:30S ribosomal protein S6 [Bacillota bacterium]